MDRFRVRLNCVDHYQAAPTDLDPPLFGPYGSTQRNNAPTLPVIRVFGATETGQKVCAHIHGALPYLYIECRGSIEQNAVDDHIQQLRASIDYALAVSYRRNLYEGNATFVAHVTLVKGVPFFGYHVGYRNFLKIYLLNPLNMTRFADLLHQGAIMGQAMQPFEAHMQFLAQWMCDFNLYGCANIECAQVKFREPVPEYLEMEDSKHVWHDRSIPEELILDSSMYPRQSHCSIEVDICVQDILNRMQIQERSMHADFVERFNPPAPDEKLVHSLAGLWRDETRRRRLRMGLKDPSSSPFPPEVLISMSADPRDTDKGGWVHEDEFKTLVAELVTSEHRDGEGPVAIDDFIKSDAQQATVKTALQSVDDLFPENLGKLVHLGSTQIGPDAGLQPYNAGIDDAQFEGLDFPYYSDEETAPDEATIQEEAPAAHTPVAVHKAEYPMVATDSATDQAVDAGFGGDSEYVAFRPNAKRERSKEGIYRDDLTSSPSSKKQRLEAEESKSETGLQSDPSDLETQHSRHARFELAPERAARYTGEHSKSEHITSTSQSSAPRGEKSNASNHLKHSQPSADISNDNGALVSTFSAVKDNGSHDGLRDGKATLRANGSSYLGYADVVTPFGARAHPRTPRRRAATDTTPNASMKREPPPLLLRLARATASTCTTKTRRAEYLIDTLPPRGAEVICSFPSLSLPAIIYRDAFYSEEDDVPERTRDYAGREFKLESTSAPFLPEFDASGTSLASLGAKIPVVVDQARLSREFESQRTINTLRNWEFANLPPSGRDVVRWATQNKRKMPKLPMPSARTARSNASKTGTGPGAKPDLSQIEGPTQKNRHGFKFSQKRKSTSVRHETQYMSTMSLEVHVNSRASLAPDPEHDQVACIFWCVKADDEDERTSNGDSYENRVGILALSESSNFAKMVSNETKAEVFTEDNELDLLNRLVDIVRDFDPDILIGYEVHNGSWGYLIERARIKYEFNLCDEFSRMKSQSHGRFGKDADRWGFNHTSTIRVTGRHMINIWRAMRGELNLLQYTMENVVFHLLHKRIPHYTFADLTAWYGSSAPRDLAKCLSYYISRVQLDLEILEANELVARTSEQARLIGVDFFSVFSRGSQFKVESFMFRIAKPENFLLVSPSRKQVGQQNALECLPLVMEPQSDLYSSPLLVLDFQSLYPSIMIAYNYCYSTCLGRIVGWRGQNKMGFADFKRQPGLLRLVQNSMNIAPNGMMYVKPEMRKSLLAKMLGEILETRVMVKSGMKVDKDDKTLQQLLNNRQLALKLLANVTYGYTSASFSGRMPCAEIADSIVQTARETLEKSIAFIHSVERWGAEVVYGDTDSLFVYLKGRSRDQAFTIGNEIAKAITDRNPRPMKLKFEKVYHPCLLLAKKRYVGFKYDSPSQVEPEFDAKGIETVRRDGTPAEQKIEEKALKMLFRTADLSQVKSYFQRQCAKIMSGKVSIQDFCFAREVKLGTYADKGPPPPGALISTRRMLADPRLEPQYGERVPYVVVTGAPKARLIDRCVAPEALLTDESAELDAEYYISKNVIPPLERIFNLVGANVRQWYDEMPKVQRVRDLQSNATDSDGERALQAPNPFKKTLESYLRSSHCLVCRTKLMQRDRPEQGGEQDEKLAFPLCDECGRSPSQSLYALRARLATVEVRSLDLEVVCRNCAGLSWAEEVKCDSKDCPVFYSRIRARARVSTERRLAGSFATRLEEASTDVG